MATFHAQHPTFHIQHLTPIISHPTLHTQHSQHPFPPAKYLCLSSAPAAQSVLLTSTPHGFCVDLWHLREKYSCAAWHIPHSAAPHAKDTFHILNTPPPNLHCFFPLRPAPRPNTPFSAHHCNRLTTSHLLSKPSRATFQTHHSPPRNAIFRPSISALSKLHPLPFAPRSLSPRNPIHAQRPRHPSFTPFPPVPIPPPKPPKPRLPALCFTQNSDTRFAPNIFNVVWFSSYRLLGVECGMIFQVDSWIDGLGMMQKCNERSTFAVVAQSAAVEQATE